MIEFDISTGDLSGATDVVKILHTGKIKTVTGAGARIDFCNGQKNRLPAAASVELDTSGIYLIPDGEAYGSLFFEHKGSILRHHDIMPIYFSAQIDNGTIDVARQRASRANIVNVDHPCILLNSVSHWVYGHWLLDIWSRYWSAVSVLGDHAKKYKLALPIDSPVYAINILRDVFGVREDQIIKFDATNDIIRSKTLIAPSLLHNSYNFHPKFSDYINQFIRTYTTNERGLPEKIYLSRRKFRSNSKSARRSIADEEQIENLFINQGFAVLYPEEVSFSQQVRYLNNCKILAGEAGSALHNAAFSKRGSVTISLSSINDVQYKLAAAFGHHLLTVNPINTSVIDGVEHQRYDTIDINAAIECAAKLANE
ncbi:glycosyltransferase 61 family protein [Methylobacterium sp. yr596]|uniref:glycosyltransferase family 61 protein n=1 Tax=Methylobacterium sp. yr596 TaxID=1761800 RepID=UPI0008EA3BF4|nr:glycosyltransferase 61 family protein [Methylobacterium sp. yr596]SFF76566.1 Protein of unknown function [Methylobacterium sp. yr596]